ncbi:expressed unknown protein [Seminavis robusta]|uniref:Uncharacterized protein n=1 Tax=Seminavis robusta TaxID=568900 RepID=A0A9N8HAT0_9STRA|nr:expressed unknown protein [Seminavis robusta]|eukprot:Sro237_g095170.1 n/a (114) ;mRNA; r:1073-1414
MAADKLPDALLQEIRNLVAVECKDVCMKDRAGGANSVQQEVFMQKVFHGSAGYASVLDKLTTGKGAYASLFDRVALENNRQGNEERSSGYMLVLKDIASCDEGERTSSIEIGY